jgi:hypothetical protein
MKIMTVACALGAALLLCNLGTSVLKPVRGRHKSFMNQGGLLSRCP